MGHRSEMNDTAVSIEHVSKTYKLFKSHSDRVRETFHPFRKKYSHDFDALKDISFNIEKGETIGIIGRNGSGKSTLLQIICGIIKPTTGNVVVNGKISALLELGAGFNPEFTGVQNVYLNSSILGLSTEETRKRFDAIAAFADIGDFIHQPVKTYSSGMYVRLAFSIAVHVHPDILIVDEALSVGDIFFQQKCAQHMREYMGDCTKLIATHDMQVVANLCDRVIVLENGTQVFEGSPLTGIEYYTKSMHNDLFRSTCRIESSVQSVSRENIIKMPDWVQVSDNAIAGACEVVIEAVKVTSRGYKPVKVVRGGDHVFLHLLIFSPIPKKDLIFGYLVKDRFGNAIFGENTAECPTGPVDIEAGRYWVRLGFEWPEIYPEEYTITFGVGEGSDPAHHVIQCWAHNAVAVSAISPGKFIHALFNNPITQMEVHAVDAPSPAGS